jgi:hypothetical protein
MRCELPETRSAHDLRLTGAASCDPLEVSELGLSVCDGAPPIPARSQDAQTLSTILNKRHQRGVDVPGKHDVQNLAAGEPKALVLQIRTKREGSLDPWGARRRVFPCGAIARRRATPPVASGRRRIVPTPSPAIGCGHSLSSEARPKPAPTLTLLAAHRCLRGGQARSTWHSRPVLSPSPKLTL